MSNIVEDLDNLRFDFIVSVSVLGVACIGFLCCICILFVWIYKLQKKIKALEPFLNFKIQRPKLFPDETPSQRNYDNPLFVKQNKSENLNPIANRTNTSFDNANFSFGPNNSRLGANNLFRKDYFDQDKFY